MPNTNNKGVNPKMSNITRRKARIAAGALVALATIFSSVACSGTPPTTTPTESPTGSPSASGPVLDGPNGPITLDTSTQITLQLITWSNQPSIDALNALDDQFSQQFPNVKIELTQVANSNNAYTNLRDTRFAANNVDIFTAQNFIPPVSWAPTSLTSEQQAVVNGNYADLTDYPWVANWSTGQTAYTYENKVYAISTGATTVTGVFYNKQMFTDHGWTVPTTWAQFMQLCNDMKTAGITPMTVGGADGWPYTSLANDVVASVEPDNNALAQGLWTGDRQFTDANSLEIYNRLDFINQNLEPGFLTIPYSDDPGRFVAGKAAMMPDGSWQAPVIEQVDSTFQFGYFPFPSDKPGNAYQGKFDLSFGVNAHSANLNWALKWMEFLSQKENYQTFVNTTDMVPTMDVTVTDPFINALLPDVQNLTSVWETVYRPPAGVGQYAAKRGFIPTFLQSAGGPNTPAQLAQLAQQDFDTAKQAVLSGSTA